MLEYHLIVAFDLSFAVSIVETLFHASYLEASNIQCAGIVPCSTLCHILCGRSSIIYNALVVSVLVVLVSCTLVICSE